MKDIHLVFRTCMIALFAFVISASQASAADTSLSELEAAFCSTNLLDWFGGVADQNDRGTGYMSFSFNHRARPELGPAELSENEARFFTDYTLGDNRFSFLDDTIGDATDFAVQHGRMPASGLELVLGDAPTDYRISSVLEHFPAVHDATRLTNYQRAFNPATGTYIDSFDNPQWAPCAVHLEFLGPLSEQEIHDFGQRPAEDGMILQGAYRYRVVIYGEQEGSVLYDETLTEFRSIRAEDAPVSD